RDRNVTGVQTCALPILEVVGRDKPDQRLYLSKDQESLVWSLDHAENELWKQPPDPVLEAVAKIVSSENREWEGSLTELAQAIQKIGRASCRERDDIEAV